MGRGTFALVAALALAWGLGGAASANGGGVPADDARLQVYVHYDYMIAPDGRSDAPDPAAIQLVVDSFAAHGIHLNIDEHHAAIPERRITTLVGFYNWCGVAAPDIVSFDTLKAEYFHPTADHEWHYAIFGYADDCERSSGSATINGDDFLVALGQYHTLLDRVPRPLRLTIVGGTFMHELGHNLGLQHGGDEGTNYKPNYLSVMNYAYQFGGIRYAAAPGSTTPVGSRLDYSGSVLPTLDESALDERAGLGGTTSDMALFCAPRCALVPTSGPIDWDRDGGSLDRVAVDVNRDGMLTKLHGFDDWALVRAILLGNVARGPKTFVKEDAAAIPEITGVTPASGPATGGSRVTITGTHLDKVDRVMFGTASAIFTIVNVHTITATAPVSPTRNAFGAPDAATVDIQVWSGAIPSITSSADRFTYTPVVPVVTSVTPSTIFNTGSARMTLRGRNFTGTTSVQFVTRLDELTQYDFTVVDDTTITFRSNTNEWCGWCVTGTFQVVVTNAFGPGGGAYVNITSAPPVPPPAAPTVTSIEPTGGPVSGGTTVVVRGSGFMTNSNYGVEYLRFGSTIVGGQLVDDNTWIAMAPPGTGIVDVTVQGPGGTSVPTSGTAFAYGTSPVPPPSPVISSFAPNSGAPGTAVTIVGTGLVVAGATPTVLFATESYCPAAVTANPDGSIIAVVPSCARTSSMWITLSNANGYTTSTAPFSVYGGGDPTVTVSAISPTSGPPGTVVTITGTNLVYPMFGIWTYVNFGCGLFWPTLHGDGTLTAVVPPCAVSGPVEVLNPFSHTFLTAPQPFTVTP